MRAFSQISGRRSLYEGLFVEMRGRLPGLFGFGARLLTSLEAGCHFGTLCSTGLDGDIRQFAFDQLIGSPRCPLPVPVKNFVRITTVYYVSRFLCSNSVRHFGRYSPTSFLTSKLTRLIALTSTDTPPVRRHLPSLASFPRSAENRQKPSTLTAYPPNHAQPSRAASFSWNVSGRCGHLTRNLCNARTEVHG